MAKHKGHRRRHRPHVGTHHRHRRRRVGAMSMNARSPLVKLAAVAAGWLLGDKLNAQVDRMIPDTSAPASTTTPAPITVNTTMPKIKAGVEVGLGALLMFKGKSHMLKTAAGGFLLGAGLKKGLRTFGVITGYQRTPVIGNRRMGGYQQTPVIGKDGFPSQLQGTLKPSQLEGYRVNGDSGYLPHGSSASSVMGSLYTNAEMNQEQNGYRDTGFMD